jgi:hypothetical protein
LLDSRDFVFTGQTTEEEVSSMLPFLFFEDFLLGALRGAAEQLATQQRELSSRFLGDESERSFHHKLL